MLQLGRLILQDTEAVKNDTGLAYKQTDHTTMLKQLAGQVLKQMQP